MCENPRLHAGNRVQNKTSISKQKSSLKVCFKFDQLIPKDKSEMGANLVYSSDDGGDNT